MSERNLAKIIADILQIAPDLECRLSSIQKDSMYAAPELMHIYWQAVADVLNLYASSHPRADEIKHIFGGAR